MRKITKKLLILFIITIALKILGLLYKISITRLIGLDGMRLIALITPSMSLALALSSLSIQAVVNQNVALNIEKKEVRAKSIMQSSLKIILISTSLTSILLLLSFPIYKYLLKDSFIYYPLLLTIPLLYLSNISAIMKGYFEAHNNFIVTYMSNLYEYSFKLIFTLILLIIFKNTTLKFKVIICFIGLSSSEIISCLYLVFKLKKRHKIRFSKDQNNTFNYVLKQALPLTFDSLIATFFSYITPFIFYYFSHLNGRDFLSSSITYTLTNTYAIPLLIHGQYTTQTISKFLFPKITRNKDKPSLNNLLESTFILCIIFSTISLVLANNYAKYLLLLLYKDLSCLYLMKHLAPIYFLIYFNPVLRTILQSFNKEKHIFFSTLTSQFLMVILIIIFTFYNPNYAYILGVSISLLFKFILLLFFCFKYTKFQFKASKIIIILCYILSFFIINQLYINIAFFIVLSLIYLVLGILFLFYLNKNKLQFLLGKKHI